ncbi:MAG TPA: hypothetical protein VEY12_06075 [Thermoplasmata archaeon]|nr:hypothetical protein [Thermoplasmata archaeon]
MRFTAFQKIGLLGIVVFVIGGVTGIVLPQMSPTGTYSWSGLGSGLIVVGGILILVGVVGGIFLAFYQAGAARERARLGSQPPRR